MQTRSRRLYVFGTIFLVGVTTLAQTKEPPKTALERRGLYHTTIEGRFLSPDGTPVPGVHVQLSAGSVRDLPVGDAITGPDGRFLMRDVNSSYMPDLRWYPQEQWLRGGIPIAGESGSNVNVGTIQLQPDTVVRVVVEIIGGPPRDKGELAPSVTLQGRLESDPRVSYQSSGAYRVLRQITFDEGTWKVTFYSKGRLEHYEAPVRLERGRRDQLFRLKLLRDTLKVVDRYSASGTLQVELETLPSSIEREFRARGRVLASDGSPLSGAIVSIHSFPWTETMPQWTVSTEDGGFDLKYQALSCGEPIITYGGNYARRASLDSHEECESRWSRPQDVVIAETTHLAVQVEGVDVASVRASWWHGSLGWTAFSSLRPLISSENYPPLLVKVDAPGLLPLVLARELQSPAKKLTAEVPLRFRYDTSTQRLLAVRANGQPLSNAIVDVEKVSDLTKNSRIQLASYRTSEIGELRLAGGADQVVEVFVYAEGYEPRRAVWIPGVPLTLDLTPRNATISFGQPAAVLVRIRPVANPAAVMTANLTTTTQMLLAPGEYDITTYTDRGSVLGYQRVTLRAADVKTIDPQVDERPRLTLRFPSTGWQSNVSESTPRGAAVNWMAMIAVVGTMQLRDTPATRTESSPTEQVYLLSRGGRMEVQARREGSPILWREISVAPRESLVVDIPGEQATLEAPSNFEPGEGHVHGIAGPRMQLIADNPAGWSVTEFIPRKERGVFKIAGIPPGDYHLYHHLFNAKVTEQFDGKSYTYNRPVPAWGGVAVHLTAGKTTRIEPLNSKLGELSVLVTDASGSPVSNATFRIRDRMSDSWRQVEENPAQVEQAGFPIPYPTAVRVVDGKAKLLQIRSGWLEFVVETDAGPSYAYRVPVGLGQELRVTVPSGSSEPTK